MLSIGVLGSGQGEYYVSLGREDYYLEGGEPPGKWLGRGAEKIGLSGTVKAEAFRNLLSGYSPEEKSLIQNAGSKDHQPGWDLTFSAPKSVSVLWAISDEETRKEIQRAHDQAVARALSYIEAEHSYTRRGKAGAERERTGLVIATFQHGTSRAQDPHLHTHAVVLNVGVREDGTTGTILSEPVFKAKRTGGAVYRAELAHLLEKKLGLQARRVRDEFEIKGVPQGLCAEFSKRRAEIEAELDRLGFEGAKAAAAVTLSTRQVKGHTARETLLREWAEVGKEHGFTREDAQQLTGGVAVKRDIQRETGNTILEAIAKITEQESHFSEKDLVRRTAEAAQGRGLSATNVIEGVKKQIAESREIVALGRIEGEMRYTTQEMIEIETRMLYQIGTLKSGAHPLNNEVCITRPLSLEQKAALYHVTETEGRIKVISGMAGTGKTTLLAAGREAWDASGYEVRGAALAGKAAKGLAEGAKIKSDTLHKTLLEIEKGNLKLTDKTVLVIDEAGMVGTRQMARVVDEVAKSGAKLVLVGDEKQLQPIDAGAPFRAIGEAVGRVELKDIRRQLDKKDIEAIHSIVAGQAKNALQSYAERGLLSVSESRSEAIDSLITDWKEDAAHNPKDALIITGTRLEAAILNRRAQEERKRAGMLRETNISLNGERFFENDRVMFTRGSRLYRVVNGDAGTIERIDGGEKVMTVRLDDGKKVKIPYRNYEHLKLGYAATTHKFQGATGEKCFVLAGGDMQDRELSYVQVSRARGETRIYTDRSGVGDITATLAKRMNKSRQKETALSVMKEAEIERASFIQR